MELDDGRCYCMINGEKEVDITNPNDYCNGFEVLDKYAVKEDMC
jgi:hypothetical protein